MSVGFKSRYFVESSRSAVNDKQVSPHLFDSQQPLFMWYGSVFTSVHMLPVSFLHHHDDDNDDTCSSARWNVTVFFLFQNYSKNFKNVNEFTMRRQRIFFLPRFSFLPSRPRYFPHPISSCFDTDTLRVRELLSLSLLHRLWLSVGIISCSE